MKSTTVSLLRKKEDIMATKTFEELKQLAVQIRDEKTNKQNTATRIGTQMLEHLNKLEQDYYDKTATNEELQARDEKLTELENNICEINLSNKYPTQGIDSGKYYDFTTAINFVGNLFSEGGSFPGLKITFLNINKNIETYEYLGDNMKIASSWQKIVSSSNYPELQKKIKLIADLPASTNKLINNNILNQFFIDLQITRKSGFESYLYAPIQIIKGSTSTIDFYKVNEDGSFASAKAKLTSTKSTGIEYLEIDATEIYVRAFVDWDILMSNGDYTTTKLLVEKDVYENHFGWIASKIYDRSLSEINASVDNIKKEQISINTNFQQKNFRWITEESESKVPNYSTQFKGILDLYINRKFANTKKYQLTLIEPSKKSISVYLEQENGKFGDYVFGLGSKQDAKGKELLYNKNNDVEIYLYIDWDVFTQPSYANTAEGIFSDESSYNIHDGYIADFIANNFPYYYLQYINNNCLCANSVGEGMGTINAYYACAKIEEGIPNCIKGKVIFKDNANWQYLTLISTKNRVTDPGIVTSKSLHCVFTNRQVRVELYNNNETDVLYSEMYSTYSEGKEYADGVEYEFGILVDGNTLKVKSFGGIVHEIDITDKNILDYMGQYVTIEHFRQNYGPMPVFTEFTAFVDNKCVLWDNFKRKNGEIGIAPSGQPYNCISNIVADGFNDNTWRNNNYTHI